ncbi:hypothetical protein JDF658_26120, partial [Carboxydocella sp. JDF658]
CYVKLRVEVGGEPVLPKAKTS